MELLDETDGTWRVPDDLSAMMEALYDEEVRYADGLLGELLDELRAGGVLDSSVLVVTSDHGEEFGDHGLLGHSDTLYREQLHVPLLVRFPPGSPHARRNGERDGVPTSHLDLAPTLVDALGLGDLLVGTTFEGVSALAAERRSPIWATRFHPDVGLLTAVRDDDLVWIEGGYRARRFETGPELYDLSSDPAEHENLVREDPGEAARLSAVRRVLLERFGRPHGGDRPAELGAEHEARLEALGY
jgi:arylsulfatase A-like enzyme